METETLLPFLIQTHSKRLGVNVIATDIDDTLLSTDIVFRSGIENFQRYIIRSIPGIDQEEFQKVFSHYNLVAYKKFSVDSQRRWHFIVDEIKRFFSHSEQEVFDHGLPILEEIYTTLPEIEEGVQDILPVIRKTDIRLVAVTHANDKWTDFKLEGTGLLDYFNDIIIIPESGYKDTESWKKAFAQNRIDPSRVLVIGDSMKGDIMASRDAGVPNQIWINHNRGWNLYREGTLPPGVETINGFLEFPSALEALQK